MERGDSWDGPMPLAAPVLAAAGALTAYHDGIAAVVGLAARFTGDAWNSPTPCPEWRAADLAGHLRCVADNYHEYLDGAPVSRLARLLGTGAHPETIARKLARQNTAELAALPDVAPEEHIAAFAESARRYAARIGPLLWLPHHSYRGRVITVAGMAGMACVEWHVHAWDLARALGQDYRPADPPAVLSGWQDGIPQLPVAAAGDPWLAVLRASGRSA
ncbi:MAG TPA: maleylpyruvate isomerase family mycothiol-dependent enzyme [Streptosporangiaceae bacterium]|nr:maleylpyruvate isomerase family mycothiol-dependent enzyme [Streptosporangiaceae bacterium]